MWRITCRLQNPVTSSVRWEESPLNVLVASGKSLSASCRRDAGAQQRPLALGPARSGVAGVARTVQHSAPAPSVCWIHAEGVSSAGRGRGVSAAATAWLSDPGPRPTEGRPPPGPSPVPVGGGGREGSLALTVAVPNDLSRPHCRRAKADHRAVCEPAVWGGERVPPCARRAGGDQAGEPLSCSSGTVNVG